MSEQGGSLGAGPLALPARDRAGLARLVPDVLSALGSAGRAGSRTCFQHNFYDGSVLTNAPIGNGTGGHADLGAIEQQPEVGSCDLPLRPELARGGLQADTVTAGAVLDALIDLGGAGLVSRCHVVTI